MLSNVIAGIQWLGHDGFQISVGETIVAIDPYEVAGGLPSDLVLVTHPHHDHCSPGDVDSLCKEGTIIVTEAESAQKLTGDIRIVKPGDRLTLAGIEIEAVPAYNVGKDFHPKAKNWLGFIITIDGIRIYHAGDTDLIAEMDDLAVDIAMLPVSGTYVMTAQEAVEAARRIRPKVAIPMHYDTIVGSTADADHFQRELAGVCEVLRPPKV